MLNDKNFWKVHLKWGIILGVMLAGIEILKMFSRKVDYQAAQLLDLAMIVGFILVLHLGVKEFKEIYPERLSFAKAFLSCIVTSVIGVVLLFGYDMLHYSVIEKDGLQQKYTTALAKYKQNLAKDTLTNAELMAYTDAATAMLNEQKEQFCNDSSVVFKTEGCMTDESQQSQIRDEVSSGILLFQQYYTGKLCSKPEADKEQYKLGNFTPYAKRVLMETLTSYIEQNEGKASTPFVQEIVQKTNEELPSIDPLDKRFEETKSHVPRYDKNGQYAAVSAMMYLLYGMFFGLFVAMFNYTSKKPIEEFVPSENEETETTNP
ncbi:MAG: DUF4199 domain-containing protein [Bacteroidales bacterium]|nr:DUF4199 domain-containing protein [Bacteroidales bacterium]